MSGKVQRAVDGAVNFDASEHEKKALRASEDSFRLIVDSIPGLVVTMTAEGELEVVSKQCLHYFGMTFDELKTWTTSDIVHSDDLSRVLATWRSSFETGQPYDSEYRIRRADGLYRWFHVRALPLRDTKGRIIRWYALHTDIDDRKRAEEALRGSAADFRLIIDSIPGLVHTMTPGGELEFVNQRNLDYFGKTLEELKGWASSDVFHPDDLPRAIDSWNRTHQTGQPDEIECRFRRADGVYRFFQLRCLPQRDSEGHIIRWISLHTDIDDRKRMEEALRLSEEHFRLIVDSIPGLVNTTTAEGEVEFFNQQILHYFGKRYEELKDWATSDIIHPDDLPAVRAAFTSSIKTGEPYNMEQRFRRADGVYRWFQVRTLPARDTEGRIIRWYSLHTDIDDLKRAEDELRRSEAYLWQAKAELEKAFEEIKRLKDRLQDENLALREQIDRALMFEEIVGASPALQAVLSRVSKVAPTDSTVLVTGETGTGKELIARAIHKRSRRSSRAFVSVNCAAIPSSLIASELFGHEKGAFTGALQRRLGRFELADEGTIFLDEVGELPAETQIALLRVLQEREFERVGGTQAIRANVRVIAATNRDLEAAIAAGTFRSDLFYRLNVFPIEIPPLRQRGEDIPLLVEYFIDHFARKAGKRFRGINKKTLELLLSYPWPGNIRELQNVVERSVIVCETENFSVDESWLSRQPVASEPTDELELSQRLAAEEKDMIEAALHETGGRVSGPSGAAAKLGIHRSTLDSKITLLKINKYRFKNPKPPKK